MNLARAHDSHEDQGCRQFREILDNEKGDGVAADIVEPIGVQMVKGFSKLEPPLPTERQR